MLSIKSFDLLLSYYDNPITFRNWAYRLVNLSDFSKFANSGRIIIADTGTPREKLSESIQMAETMLGKTSFKWVYLRSDTDELRKLVRPDFSARMNSQSVNNVCLDFSDSELIIFNNVGNIISPEYFKGHLLEHIKNEKAVVLPERYDLFSETYHEEDYKMPWIELLKKGSSRKEIVQSGGWPDMSVRRKWLVEINGFDEWYQFPAPNDMDVGSRLCGKLDNGAFSEELFPEKPSYKNLGLDFIRPYNDFFFSLTCNTYKGHVPSEDRKVSYEHGIEYYLNNWGKIVRNENRVPTKYEILAGSK